MRTNVIYKLTRGRFDVWREYDRSQLYGLTRIFNVRLWGFQLGIAIEPEHRHGSGRTWPVCLLMIRDPDWKRIALREKT